MQYVFYQPAPYLTVFVDDIVEVQEISPPTVRAVGFNPSLRPEWTGASVLEQCGMSTQDDHVGRSQSDHAGKKSCSNYYMQ